MSVKHDIAGVISLSGVIRYAPTGATPFVLKSGRESRYFFDASYLPTMALQHFSSWIAQALGAMGTNGDLSRTIKIVYGPPYKAIPLAVTVADSIPVFGRNYWKRPGYLYNRKEVKDHGEGGIWIGQTPSSSDDTILIVDDVLSDGTAKEEAVALLRDSFPGCTIAGIFVIFDRQEADPGLRDRLGVPIWSLITADEYFGPNHPDRS